MGFLSIGSGTLANFNKLTASVWFNAPAAVLSSAIALSDNPADGQGDGWNGTCFTPPLYKIIPLITFGSHELTLSGASTGNPCSPSFIGIDCDMTVFGKTNPTLAVNLQTAATCTFNKTPQSPENEDRAECYYMGGFDASQALYVLADTWHHALISLDLSGGCSITWANANRSPPDPASVITPGSKFSWAFDGAPMVGPSMYKSGGSNWGIADDYIVPQGLFNIVTAGDYTAFPIEDSTDFVVSVSGGISSAGSPVGIPSSVEFVSSIFDIRMADIQIFTDVYLDCANTTNIEAFITDTGNPAPPALAAALLGKSPEILFQTDSDWRTGNNRGTIGPFDVTGTVSAFSPSP